MLVRVLNRLTLYVLMIRLHLESEVTFPERYANVSYNSLDVSLTNIRNFQFYRSIIYRLLAFRVSAELCLSLHRLVWILCFGKSERLVDLLRLPCTSRQSTF